MMSSIVSFYWGLSLNLISTSYQARKLKFMDVHTPSLLQTNCSTHNWRRYIFQNLLWIRTNWKIVGSNFFWKLKIDVNLVVKSKLPPRSGSVALRQLNFIHKKGPSSFFFLNNTWSKAYSEEWIWTRRCLYIIYLQINKLLQTTLENYM